MADDQVAAQAVRFAKIYVATVEALQREGVPEILARAEARLAAATWLNEAKEEGEGERCPCCGK